MVQICGDMQLMENAEKSELTDSLPVEKNLTGRGAETMLPGIGNATSDHP